MRRANLPDKVVKLNAMTIETAFPTKGALAAELLPRVRVDIWTYGCGHKSTNIATGDNPGCVVFPLPAAFNPLDGPCREGPVDCDGYGGDYLVPVCRPVWTRLSEPPIPVVNGVPGTPGRGGRRAPLLSYPAFRIDEYGRLAVRWDQHLHALPVGRYAANVLVDGVVCGIFEIDKTYCCPLDVRDAQSADLVNPPARQPKPEGVTDVFDAIYDWTSTTTCQLNPGDTTVAVADSGALCDTVLCRQPQLVITDGVTREVVTFVGCIGENRLELERSGANTIQAGAIIRFEWTPDNVVAAAEGC